MALTLLTEGAGYAAPERSSLAVASFSQPFVAVDELAHAVNAYLRCSIEKRRGPTGGAVRLDEGLFLPMLVGDKRIALRAYERSKDGATCALRLEANGHAFRALLRDGTGEILAIEDGEAMPPLGFPGAARIDIDSAALARARQIYAGRGYALSRDDQALLSAALTAFLSAGFRAGYFNEVPAIDRFFDRGGFGIEQMAASAVFENGFAPTGVGMAKAIHASRPEYADDLASLVAGLGRIYYETRVRRGFETAETCWHIAHILDPDNLKYHNDWAWALNHCHRVKEARDEIRALIARDPDNVKFHVEMAVLESKDVERRIRDLERTDVAVMPLDLYLKETASLASSIQEIIELTRIDAVRQYPRALSVVGNGFLHASRLNMFKLTYLLAREPDDVRQAGMLAQVIIEELRNSALHHAAAVDRAGRTEGEAAHARGMFTDMVVRGEQLIALWQNTVERGGIVFPRTAPQIRYALKRIDAVTRDPKYAFLGGSINSTIESVVANFDTLHAILPDVFREAALGLDEADIDDAAGYPDRMAARARATLEARGVIAPGDKAVAGTLGHYATHYAGFVGGDRFGRAVLYVYQHVLDPTNRNPKTILEFCKCYLNEEELADGSRKLAYLIRQAGLVLTPERNAQDDDRVGQIPPDHDTNLIGRDILKEAAEDGKNGIVVRARTLADSYARISFWEAEGGMQPNYVFTLKEQADALVLRAENLAGEIKRYLAIPTSASKRERESAGMAVSGSYRQVKRDLKELERLFGKRHMRIKKIIIDRSIAIRSGIAELRALFPDVSIDWVEDQLALLDGYAAALAALADESGDSEYLSFELYLSLTEQADATASSLAFVARKLESYREVFGDIRHSEKELERAERFFAADAGADQAAATVMRKYREALADARERIFSFAVEGRDLASLHENERTFYAEIRRRTGYLADLRRAISETLERFDLAASDADPEMVTESRDAIRRIEQVMKDDVTKPPRSGDYSILEAVCEPARSCPSDETMTRILEQLDAKCNALYLTELAASDARLNRFLHKAAWVSRLIPGGFTNADRKRLISARDAMRRNVEILSRLAVARDGFYEAFLALEADNRVHRDEYDAIVDRVYAAARTEGVAGFDRVIRVAEWWLDRYMLDPSDETAERFRDDFRRLSGKIRDFLVEPRMVDAEESWRAREELNDLVKGLVAEHDANRIMTRGLSEHITQTFLASSHFNDVLNAVPRFLMDEEKNEVVNFLYPVMREGEWKDVEMVVMLLYQGDIRSLYLEKLSHFAYDLDVPDELVTKALAVLHRMDSVYNRYVRPRDGSDQTVRMNPVFFRKLFTDLVSFYSATCNLKSYKNTAEMPGVRSLALTDVMEWLVGCMEIKMGMPDDLGGEAQTLMRLMIDPQTIAELRTVESRGGFPISDRTETVADLHRRLFLTSSMGWLVTDERSVFLKALSSLVRDAIGVEWDPAWADIPDASSFFDERTLPILTVPEAGGMRIFSSYPPLGAYRGVYIDPGTLTFRASTLDAGPHSVELCRALEEAIRTYLGALRRAPVVPGDEAPEWERELDAVISAVKARAGRIDVAVVSGLPVNSLLVNGTILLNDDFVAFLLSRMNRGEAPRLILGERLFHELGHLADESYLRSVRGVFNKRVEAEVRQLTRDTIMHARLFGYDEVRRDSVDRLVHEYPDGRDEKFSRVFVTEYLFRSMNEWARLYRNGQRDLMADRIRSLVIDALHRLSISNPAVFAFPNADAGDEASRQDPLPQAPRGSLESALAAASARALSELDARVANSRGGRDAAFCAKKRLIAISDALVPPCQRRLIGTINKMSRKAVDEGRTKEAIRICSYAELAALRSDASTDVVLIMDAAELASYTGDEARLAFSRSGDDPVLLNGLVAAGRAVLYGEMDLLREILEELSSDPGLVLPDAGELERLLRNDKGAFARRLTIALPAMSRFDGKEQEALNRVIMEVMQYV